MARVAATVAPSPAWPAAASLTTPIATAASATPDASDSGGVVAPPAGGGTIATGAIVAALERAVGARPRRRSARPVAASWIEYVLGQADSELGEFKDAAVAWARIGRRPPRFQPVYLDPADNYVKLNERPKALDVPREVRRRWPKMPTCSTISVSRLPPRDARCSQGVCEHD